MRTTVLTGLALLVLVSSSNLTFCADGMPPAVAPAQAGKAEVQPVVPVVRDEVQPEMDRHLAAPLARTKERLGRGDAFPARFKTPVRRKGIKDPWDGMGELETSGLTLAATAQGGLAKLPALVDALGTAAGRPAAEAAVVPTGKLRTLEEHATYWLAVLEKARAQRDAGIIRLSKEQRQSLFARPAEMLPAFGPQMSLSGRTRPILEQDHAFCAIFDKDVDWPKFAGAARTLAGLAGLEYLAALKKTLEAVHPIKDTVAGVSGDILYQKETPRGLILVGGKGANTYDHKVAVALLIDLGGDDHYKGVAAASFDADHPHGVLIDVAGNDTYEAGELGLATGRLGVGLLLDLEGTDTYHLATGTGGAGFGGIGILCDVAGDDTYTGSSFTQGAAIAGLGLLLDLQGKDKYTSFGYAIGLGGPGGAGAVVDVAGNDSYQCGHKFPSGYNESDAPGAKPGDPAFQWDCFGLGMGLGRRVFPPSDEGNAFNLAGGVGAVIDVVGDDRYDSSNFSQACGYFFGVGLKLDLAGDDTHGAARYGHAAGAHFGMGLFIDYAGKDTYTSTGPTYNGGCAWDYSTFLFIDAGEGDDLYQWERSAGIGVADYSSWGVFAERGGKDRYAAGNGLGRVSNNSVAVFFDRSGADDYEGVKGGGDPKPANGKTASNKDGGLFLDR